MLLDRLFGRRPRIEQQKEIAQSAKVPLLAPEQVEFEAEAITDIAMALRMLSDIYHEVNVEGSIIDHSGKGPYIECQKITGWPEHLEWIKNYALSQDVFEQLRARGYIKTGYARAKNLWRITSEGEAEIRRIRST